MVSTFIYSYLIKDLFVAQHMREVYHQEIELTSLGITETTIFTAETEFLDTFLPFIGSEIMTVHPGSVVGFESKPSVAGYLIPTLTTESFEGSTDQ